MKLGNRIKPEGSVLSCAWSIPKLGKLHNYSSGVACGTDTDSFPFSLLPFPFRTAEMSSSGVSALLNHLFDQCLS